MRKCEECGLVFIKENPPAAYLYFHAVEHLVNDVRPHPLRLDPEDYQLAQIFFRESIPLAVVQEGIADCIEKLDGDVLNSLRRAQWDIRKAWKRTKQVMGEGSVWVAAGVST